MFQGAVQSITIVHCSVLSPLGTNLFPVWGWLHLAADLGDYRNTPRCSAMLYVNTKSDCNAG